MCNARTYLPAIYDLGANFYYNGVGTEKNLKLSEYYLKMAVDAGLPRAKVKYEQYTDKEMKVLNNLKEYNGKHSLFANGYKYEGQPVIMSEYGGIAIYSEEGWGYGKQVKDGKEFVDRFTKLTKAINNIPYISGYCYTQLTDVQQEINGLMDSERNYKIAPNIIRKVNNKK